MIKLKKILFRTLVVCLVLTLLLAMTGLFINGKVKHDTSESIIYKAMEHNGISQEDADRIKEFGADCILVLGAGITDESTPSPILKDRLDIGIELYQKGVAPKLLLSGDNGQEEHNEIHVMLNYAKAAGVPEEDIFCDHAGFSTYDSMYRALSIFGVKKALVVTQQYHEYRALYIGKELGLDVRGVAADQHEYAGQSYRDFREMLARNKDFIKVMTEAESTLGGEAIPINGSGVISHGE